VSDLSRLLGDVYGASSPPAEDVDAADPTSPPAVPAAADDPPAPPVEDLDAGPGPAAPGWADESVLDEAFAEWVPGPPSDADAEERDILSGVEPAEAVAEEFDIDAWLGPDEAGAPADVDATVADQEGYEAFVPTAVEPELLPQPEPEPVVDAGPWTRGSDDLLPRGRRARRLSLSLRR
jgi:hypothetical protein